MSAWMTTDIHRSALVQEAIVRGLVAPAEADRLWQRLTWDNHYALHCRYGDELEWDSWEDVPVERTAIEAPLNPWAVLKAISCWNYQCAEFDGWDQTTAHILMQDVWDLICLELDVLDDQPYNDPRYNDPPWGVDAWEQVLASSSSTTPTV
jgi:hypothetical protein